MNEKLLTNEALEGKIEYIDKLMYYFDYAEEHDVCNVAEFIKGLIDGDKKCYIMVIDGNLDRLSKEEK